MYEIKNIKKGFLGTINFELKAKGHRGFQNFIFYPIGKGVENAELTIQSNKRFGKYIPKEGKIILSKSRSGSYGSSSAYFNVDAQNNDLVSVILSDIDKTNINVMISISDENGKIGVMTFDNQGAKNIEI